MLKDETISLSDAVMININVMLGSGIFINTVILSQHVGALGFAMYLTAGLFMLPLILCIAELSSDYKESNFYTFGNIISPYWGFISTWSYFVGKLGSAALSVHVFNTFLQHICPYISGCNTFHLDIFVIIFFVLLNMLNVKTGSKIQAGFVFMKGLPLLFAIFAGLF